MSSVKDVLKDVWRYSGRVRMSREGLLGSALYRAIKEYFEYLGITSGH